MPSLTPKRVVRYTEADLNAVRNVSTILQFMRDYDEGFATKADAVLEQVDFLEVYIKSKRAPKVKADKK